MDSDILSPDQETSLRELIGFQKNTLSLLWSGNRNGFEASTFHKLCDGKPNTLTVVQDGAWDVNSVFGGYTAIPWSSTPKTHSDSTAFLFSLINPQNKPLKLKAKENGKIAVTHISGSGPVFGMEDLYISDNSNHENVLRNGASKAVIRNFEIPDDFSLHECVVDEGEFQHYAFISNFQVKNIEVYQVI